VLKFAFRKKEKQNKQKKKAIAFTKAFTNSNFPKYQQRHVGAHSTDSPCKHEEKKSQGINIFDQYIQVNATLQEHHL